MIHFPFIKFIAISRWVYDRRKFIYYRGTAGALTYKKYVFSYFFFALTSLEKYF